jgi:hypothetical protein
MIDNRNLQHAGRIGYKMQKKKSVKKAIIYSVYRKSVIAFVEMCASKWQDVC